MKLQLYSLLLVFIWFIQPIYAEPNELPVSQLPFVSVPTRPGWEERGPEFRKWLSPSVRIGGGSGTMVYYDPFNNDMYVISAGHLFRQGRFRANRNTPVQVTIEVFYHNNKKLPEPKSYRGEVLCYTWGGYTDIYDVSLMRFKPDWSNPWYLPIAPVDYKLEPNRWYHSIGCDGKSETAHYLVQFVMERSMGDVTELVTQYNAPRGGRSGGGVFTDDGLLIAICSRGGNNTGLWTSLMQIHRFLKEEGYTAILNGYSPALKIPIVDRNSPRNDRPTRVLMPNFTKPEFGINLP